MRSSDHAAWRGRTGCECSRRSAVLTSAGKELIGNRRFWPPRDVRDVNGQFSRTERRSADRFVIPMVWAICDRSQNCGAAWVEFSPMADEFTAEDIWDLFEGMAMTLMSSTSLRRELALLHVVLRRSAGAGLWLTFPQHWSMIVDATEELRRVLPAVAPGTAEELVHVQQLPEGKRTLLLGLTEYAWGTLRQFPREQTWLVPSVYSLRIPMLLEQQMLHATVRPVRVPPWIGRH